jgi:hypothetical protein
MEASVPIRNSLRARRRDQRAKAAIRKLRIHKYPTVIFQDFNAGRARREKSFPEVTPEQRRLKAMMRDHRLEGYTL